MEYKSSSPFITIAEFIMRTAVSTENPATRNRSTRSNTISLSLQAVLPEPIPSESPSSTSPHSCSRKEKLSPDICAPSFFIRAIPCTLRNFVSSYKTNLAASFAIKVLHSESRRNVFESAPPAAVTNVFVAMQPPFLLRSIASKRICPSSVRIRCISSITIPCSFAR